MSVAPFGDYAVPCPACQVPAGERCTQPTNTSRSPVAWTHHSRHSAAVKKANEKEQAQ